MCITIEVEDEGLPDKTPAEDLKADDCVGIDFGILNYIHTSDGISIDGLELKEHYQRLKREQRTLSRKNTGRTIGRSNASASLVLNPVFDVRYWTYSIR